jgi:uncharacterized protein (UPF0332 family)
LGGTRDGALLFLRGLQSKSHSGAMSLFNRAFVRPGTLPATWNARIGHLQQLGHTADYAADIPLARSDVEAAIADAAAFIAVVAGVLAAK